MVCAELEDGGDLSLRLAFADERAVAARAKRQREGVEQNRFAGAGLAGENGEAAAERKIELIDQDDVADGEINQHPARRLPRASRRDYAAARRARLNRASRREQRHSRGEAARDNVIRACETAKRKSTMIRNRMIMLVSLLF